MLLQPAAVLAVVRVLAVGQVLGHQPQGGGGEGSTDEVEHQHAFDLWSQEDEAWWWWWWWRSTWSGPAAII